jgi:hypothetical protein
VVLLRVLREPELNRRLEAADLTVDWRRLTGWLCKANQLRNFLPHAALDASQDDEGAWNSYSLVKPTAGRAGRRSSMDVTPEFLSTRFEFVAASYHFLAFVTHVARHAG